MIATGDHFFDRTRLHDAAATGHGFLLQLNMKGTVQ